jgi:hypothetical protein
MANSHIASTFAHPYAIPNLDIVAYTLCYTVA